MYIFNAFSLLQSYNPSFLICLCFNMVSFRGKKKAWATPRLVSFRVLIQNFRRAPPPLSYVELPSQVISLPEVLGTGGTLSENARDACHLALG